MEEYLAYQFPNDEIKVFTGLWKSCMFSELPKTCFFVSDFSKEDIFYFEVKNEISLNAINSSDFSFSKSLNSISENQYKAQLENFKNQFESSKIDKAIFSRIELVPRANENTVAIFKDLCDRYKNEAFIYLISSKLFETWVGATPEVLLKGNGNEQFSMSLAGTKDDENKEWSPKELEEQMMVTNFMETILSTYSTSSVSKSEVKTIKSGAVYHLRTDFNFHVESDKWNDLIAALHPTPAVCGLPRDKAFKHILNHETHNRELYTGIIGFKGEDELAVYVNLRCMQILKNDFALYLGGGITKSSDVDAEWEETINKSKTLLTVINQNEF